MIKGDFMQPKHIFKVKNHKAEIPKVSAVVDDTIDDEPEVKPESEPEKPKRGRPKSAGLAEVTEVSE